MSNKAIEILCSNMEDEEKQLRLLSPSFRGTCSSLTATGNSCKNVDCRLYDDKSYCYAHSPNEQFREEWQNAKYTYRTKVQAFAHRWDSMIDIDHWWGWNILHIK